MREIKFRAWLTQEKQMVNVSRLDFFDKNGKPTLVMWYQMQTGTQVGLADGFELMQYTGQKDKYGKEIWEGDLVRYKQEPYLYVVKWNKAFSQFVAANCDVIDLITNTLFEVVDNIYENSELFKKKKGVWC